MKKRVCLTFVALIVGLAAMAHSTVIRSATLEETIALSESIVIGRVTSLSPYKIGDGRVMTAVRVHVEESLAGSLEPGETIRVTTYGGSFRGRQTIVPGAARYSKGDRVLLQLERIDGRLHTLGLALGKWTLSRDAFGADQLTRSLSGLGVAGRVPMTEGPLALEEFRGLVERSRAEVSR